MMLEGGLGPAVPDRGDERIRRVTSGLLGVLDERQRRLYAGLESLRHGRGGDGRVAAQLDIAPATVAKRRVQLLSGDYETERVRKPGAGVRRSKKDLR